MVLIVVALMDVLECLMTGFSPLKPKDKRKGKPAREDPCLMDSIKGRDTTIYGDSVL